MPATGYSQITDPPLQLRVRARYVREITSLEALGFHPLAFCLEELGPLSALLRFPILLLMLLKREVIVIRPPLRLAVANILLFQSSPPSIALLMGMGVKIYTAFSDNSLLISTTFSNEAIPLSHTLIIRVFTSGNLHEAWELHRSHVSKLEAGGRTANATISFSSYVDYSRREEDLSQYTIAAA